MDAADGKALPRQPSARSEGRYPIGSIFVELGFITDAQLEAALVVQRRTGSQIGEILVEQGSLTRRDLASALAEHWEPRRLAPEQGRDSVQGEAATQLGWSAVDRAALAELRRSVDDLAAQRVGDTLATGARLAGAEADRAALAASLAALTEDVVQLRAELRLAEQILASKAEGYLAFAPTDEGYRLVELPGTPPELGSTVEVVGCDGRLAVTRYGSSPLPFDGRPCAYLDRA